MNVGLQRAIPNIIVLFLLFRLVFCRCGKYKIRSAELIIKISESFMFGSFKLKFIFHKKGAKKSQLHEICRILPRENSNKLQGAILGKFRATAIFSSFLIKYGLYANLVLRANVYFIIS